MEAGERGVGRGVLHKMSKALGVSPAELRPDLADLALMFSPASKNGATIASPTQHCDGSASIQGEVGETLPLGQA